ncbi:MAG: MATE family efflux transporter [Lysobacterales bacterium]
MKDLAEGGIPGHLFRMAVPIAIGMVFRTLCYLVDLYFVARLGDAAIAAVQAALTWHLLVRTMNAKLRPRPLVPA